MGPLLHAAIPLEVPPPELPQQRTGVLPKPSMNASTANTDPFGVDYAPSLSSTILLSSSAHNNHVQSTSPHRSSDPASSMPPSVLSDSHFPSEALSSSSSDPLPHSQVSQSMATSVFSPPSSRNNINALPRSLSISGFGRCIMPTPPSHQHSQTLSTHPIPPSSPPIKDHQQPASSSYFHHSPQSSSSIMHPHHTTSIATGQPAQRPPAKPPKPFITTHSSPSLTLSQSHASSTTSPHMSSTYSPQSLFQETRNAGGISDDGNGRTAKGQVAEVGMRNEAVGVGLRRSATTTAIGMTRQAKRDEITMGGSLNIADKTRGRGDSEDNNATGVGVKKTTPPAKGGSGFGRFFSLGKK